LTGPTHLAQFISNRVVEARQEQDEEDEDEDDEDDSNDEDEDAAGTCSQSGGQDNGEEDAEDNEFNDDDEEDLTRDDFDVKDVKRRLSKMHIFSDMARQSFSLQARRESVAAAPRFSITQITSLPASTSQTPSRRTSTSLLPDLRSPTGPSLSPARLSLGSLAFSSSAPVPSRRMSVEPTATSPTRPAAPSPGKRNSVQRASSVIKI
jgi:hypothetical protein